MGPNGIFGPTVQANPTEGPQEPQHGPKRHLWANGTSKSHLGPPGGPEWPQNWPTRHLWANGTSKSYLGPLGPQNKPKQHPWANGTIKSHLGPPRAPEAPEWALGLTVRAYPTTGPQGPQRPRMGPTSICGQTVQANLVRGLPTRRRYPQKATHMLAEASGAKI